MKYIKTFIIMTSLLLIISPRRFISDVVRFDSKGLDLFNVRESKNNGKSIYKISDLTYHKNSLPHITDIILSFNSPSSVIIKDDTKKYNIRFAAYQFVKKSGTLGGGGAKFFKADHRIEIETEKNLWLGSRDDLGSFTIEFRIRPLSLKDGSVLFSRVGFMSGLKNGIIIVIKSGRISVRLYGLFKDSNGRRINVFLNRGKMIKRGKWHHFMLSFDRISGKLSKHINGDEEEVVYLSETGEPFISVFAPSFISEDLPVAVIGKDFFGCIDEFRISHRHIENLKKETEIAYKNYRALGMINRFPINREGVITSKVYSFHSSGTKVTLFKWNEILRKHTFVWMEFRISDNMFKRDDLELKWYRIINNQRRIYLKKVGKEFLRGKYYQWRAHLIPSPDARYSPTINDIELHYQLDPPPRAPLFVEVKKIGNRHVRLRWKKNVEHDILGYKIYYGIRSKRYDGIIGFIEGRRITNSFNKTKNYIEVEVTSNVIDENRKKEKMNVLNYPQLKNNVLYFFSVSAYDRYKPDTMHNHESELSKEVTARPFSGSEID